MHLTHTPDKTYSQITDLWDKISPPCQSGRDSWSFAHICDVANSHILVSPPAPPRSLIQYCPFSLIQSHPSPIKVTPAIFCSPQSFNCHPHISTRVHGNTTRCRYTVSPPGVVTDHNHGNSKGTRLSPRRLQGSFTVWLQDSCSCPPLSPIEFTALQ